jgi:hypothetical protein
VKPLKPRKTAKQEASDYVDDRMVSLWHEETDPQEAGKKALALAKAIETTQKSRCNRNLDHAKLYANQDLSSIYDMGVSSSVQAGGVYLSLNVIESCINTLAAKTTRTRIRPVVQTERGKRSQRRAAEGMTQFLDGCFYSSELHEGEGEQMFVDGACFGTGVAFTDGTIDREVLTERVLPDEMIIDDTEAMYGRRYLGTAARKKYVHIDTLMRMPDGKGGKGKLGDDRDTRQAIRNARVERIPGQPYRAEASQMVPVYSMWRLPSQRGAGDGRHLMMIEGRTLLAKEWKRSRLPFDFFIFQRKTVGIWGRSLAEQLVPIQLKINDIIDLIDDGQEAAVPRTFYQSQTINPEDFDNELGRLIETNGPPSQAVFFHPGLGASEEMYADLENWVRRSYEITGISMLSATAEKPEGISSAVALRELLDREDLRFAPMGKRWERFNRDIAWTQIETADELYAERPLLVQVPGDKFIKTVDWSAVRLDRDKYTVTIGAASSLPTTPAARKQYAQDLLELGVITKERFAEIIDESGDVKAATSMVTAASAAIEMDIEKIVEEGKWCAPDPLLDPALARDMALQEYAKCRHEDVEEDRMEMLRRYLLLATKYAGPQPAANQNAGPAEQADAAAANVNGGQPMAVGGEPPPGSDTALGMGAPQDIAAAAPQPAPAVAPAQ